MFPMIAAGLAGIVIFCGVLFVLLARAKKSGTFSDESVTQINRRREPRVPVTSDFDLFWQDTDASHKSARAKGSSSPNMAPASAAPSRSCATR